MAYRKKNVIINVYKPSDGSFIASWSNFEFLGFTKELNAGVGECVITLDKVFDYGGIDLLTGNDVEIRISDRDITSATTPGDPGKIIYSGYISLIERAADSKDKVVVHLLGHYTKLATDILKNGTQTTLYSYGSGLTTTSGSLATCDIGKLMRAVIDRYRAENTTTKINYDYLDVPDSGGTAVKYILEQKTYREAMDKLKMLAPVGIYYYINAENKVKFKAKPTTPTHKFIFGRHFENVNVQQSMEKVRNFLVVWNGEPTGGSSIYKHYQDDASIAQYGRRAETLNDYGIGDSNAADNIGAKFLDENKDPEVKVICTIFDNNGQDNYGYDIESIEPGDTCSFYGFNSSLSEIFRDNMLITKVQYFLDKVQIEVEAVKSGLLDFQDQQQREISDINSGGIAAVPETYS